MELYRCHRIYFKIKDFTVDRWPTFSSFFFSNTPPPGNHENTTVRAFLETKGPRDPPYVLELARLHILAPERDGRWLTQGCNGSVLKGSGSFRFPGRTGSGFSRYGSGSFRFQALSHLATRSWEIYENLRSCFFLFWQFIPLWKIMKKRLFGYPLRTRAHGTVPVR